MKKYIILCLVFSFLSCGDDDRDLDLNIKLKYENEPFVFFSDLTYPDGTAFQISNISMYISDINISDGSTAEQLSEVEFLSLGTSHQNMEEALEGYTKSFEKVAMKKATELNFNIGLTADQNSTVPSDYSGSNPLSKSSEYWLSWNSYIFVKFEGFYDSDADGMVETGFNLHLGSDAVMRKVELNNISDNGDVISLEIDLYDIFNNDGIYDLQGVPNIHSLEQIEFANFLANNLALAIKND